MNKDTPTQPASSYAKPDLHLDDLRSVPPGARQVIVPVATFHTGHVAATQEQTWTAIIHQQFLPLGLVVWGADPDAVITAIRVGNCAEAGLDVPGVPASFFDTGRSFDDLKRLAEMGELGAALPDRMILKLTVCELGNSLRITTRGRFEGAAFWGLAREGWQHGTLDSRIWKTEKHGYRAEVVSLEIFGPVLRFGASTESEGAATELVKAYLTKNRH